MKRSCLFFLFSLLVLAVIGALVWQQRGWFLDFASDVERSASAPVPRSFEEVASGLENVEVVESVEDIENGAAEEEPEIVSEVDKEETQETPSITPPLHDSTTSSLPPVFNLAVPFTSQAPFGNWDMVHEDACEEAALYMIDEFYKGTPAGQIAAATADAELLKIVEFEKALFGFFESTSAIQISILAEQMYGYERAEVVIDPTVEDLKNFIVAGYPVIVPTAGRLLGNPNFTGEGPLYHALVLKGYTETTFVTNDPGTRRGADYQYNFETIMNAMHDWNGGDVENGAKAVVVIYPNE